MLQFLHFNEFSLQIQTPGSKRMYSVVISATKVCHWEMKGRFPERVVLADVPSVRFSFRGNMRMYPRSCLRSEGTMEHPNVPSFRFLFRGNIRQNHPFGKDHPLSTPEYGSSFGSWKNIADGSGFWFGLVPGTPWLLKGNPGKKKTTVAHQNTVSTKKSFTVSVTRFSPPGLLRNDQETVCPKLVSKWFMERVLLLVWGVSGGVGFLSLDLCLAVSEPEQETH